MTLFAESTSSFSRSWKVSGPRSKPLNTNLISCAAASLSVTFGSVLKCAGHRLHAISIASGDKLPAPAGYLQWAIELAHGSAGAFS